MLEMRESKNKVKPDISEMVEMYEKILPTWLKIPKEWKN